MSNIEIYTKNSHKYFWTLVILFIIYSIGIIFNIHRFLINAILVTYLICLFCFIYNEYKRIMLSRMKNQGDKK